MNVAEFRDNLTAMLHGGTLNKVRNFEDAMKRAANTLLLKVDPLGTMRRIGLSEAVHDDVFNYSLPTDFKKIIDLYPQNKRQTHDTANRRAVETFDLQKALRNKTVSIEGSDGTRLIRINWRTRQPKTLNELDSLTANGTWDAFATASNLKADTINFVSGGGSVSFDLAVSGDGIQNNDMNAVDLTDEDEVADLWVRFFIKNATDLAKLTSGTLRWGNTLTTAFWLGVAQTAQADGTAFRVGWNEIKIPWSTAIETGTVDPTVIDTLRMVFATTGAITQIHVDQITVSIGRNFDIKYYSKFLIKNSAGTYITKTTDDDDEIVLDDDAIQLYLLETLNQTAHQIEGADSGFDINWVKKELNGDPNSPDPSGRRGLYAKYRKDYPSQAKKETGEYSSKQSFRRFRE